MHPLLVSQRRRVNIVYCGAVSFGDICGAGTSSLSLNSPKCSLYKFIIDFAEGAVISQRWLSSPCESASGRAFRSHDTLLFI